MAQQRLLDPEKQSQIYQEFLDFFNKNKESNVKSAPYIKGQELITEFQKEYSLAVLESMELDDYIVGKENNVSFCNILEKGKYAPVGPGIGGNTAEKFGIYFSKKIQKYVSLTNRNGIANPEKYWESMRQHLIEMIVSIKEAKTVDEIKDENVYSDLKGMSLVLVKLAFAYNPDKVLAISGKTYLYDILKLFGINIDKNVNTSVRLSYVLNKAIRENIPELKDEESELISRILWIFYQQRQEVKQRIWLVAAGTNGDAWKEFKKENVIAISYDNADLGPLTGYCSKKEISTVIGAGKMNDSLAAWQFCSTMNIGDIVYVKKGTKTLLGKGVISGAYTYDDSRKVYKHRRSVKWINTEEKEIPKDGIILPQKTLTDETGENVYIETFEKLYGLENIIERPLNKYTKEDFLDEVFMTSEEYDTINELLNRKKNIIFAGVPGVGKTFIAKKLIESRDNVAKVEIVQFHQSYSYEDFIQGYRPQDNGNFELEDGVFYNLVMEARKSKREEIETGEPAREFFIIIDEINRGNLSKIFGELLMLIEADKRSPKWGINLTYSKENDDDFYIPDNLYIIGTMNTADRSLTMIDYALRRRFAFVSLEPKFSTDEFRKYMSNRIDEDMVDKIVYSYTELNNFIEKNLGKDFQIGHSYFIPQGLDIENYGAIYKDIVEYEIKPLLEEYFYDDPNKVKEALNIINIDL